MRRMDPLSAKAGGAAGKAIAKAASSDSDISPEVTKFLE
jgi:hypothetical protein